MQSSLVSSTTKRNLLAFVVPVLLTATGSSVFAVPTLTFQSASSPTITRYDADDGVTDGKINFSGSIGNFIKVTAFADPTLGSSADPDLNFLSLDISSA